MTCRVLFVGRLCHAFISQCRHIKQIMDGGRTVDAKSRTITRYDFAYVVFKGDCFDSRAGCKH